MLLTGTRCGKQFRRIKVIQHRYQVLHIGCGNTEIVACWSDANDQDQDEEIIKFVHECHTTPLGQREKRVEACKIALAEEKPIYEITKRRF